MKKLSLFFFVLIFISNLGAQNWISHNPDGSTTYDFAQRFREIAAAEKETLVVASDQPLVDKVLAEFKDPIKLLTRPSDRGFIIISTTICVRGDIFEVSGRTILSVIDYVIREDTLKVHWVFDVNKDLVPDCEVYFTFHRDRSVSEPYEFILDDSNRSNSVKSDKIFRSSIVNLKPFIQ